jgi:hypothetical protein
MRLRHSAFHCLVLTCLGCLGFAKNKSAGWVSALNLGSDVPRMSFGLTAALQSGCRRGLELCHLYRSTVDRRRLFRPQRRDLVAPIEGQDGLARSRKSRSDGPTCGLYAETLQTRFQFVSYFLAWLTAFVTPYIFQSPGYLGAKTARESAQV